jgi:hypothetical protein
MHDDRIFKAEPPRSALRHGWWALPLIAVAVIAWLKPWRDGPAVEFVIPPPPVPTPAEVAARVYPVGVQPAASKPAPPPAAASRAQR